MNSLCLRIQEEKDYQRFEALLRELNVLVRHKERRFPQHGFSPASQRTRPWKTATGIVQKILKNVYPDQSDTVEISITEAEDLFREIRIENTFTGIDGKPVALTQGATVDVTFEADARDTAEKIDRHSS